MASVLQDLKDLRRDLGDWYDYLNCDFNLSSTTFRAKRKTKLKTLDVNAQAHMFAVRELPSILEKAIEQIEEREAALTRILKWAREHTYNNWSEAGDAEAYANGPAEELIDALSDAGFEIDAHGHLVIHGGRVEERRLHELPSPNLTPNEDGEICCPGCGRMVGATDWAVELADVCGACERGDS